MAGRPTDYTHQLAEKICERIAQGESVRSIARDPEMPAASTIFKWALENKDFSEQYAHAKEIGSEIEFEELEQIARTEEDVQRAKLIVDTKKWALSKKLPKKYGDKLDVTSDGEKITPIYGGISRHNSNEEDISTDKAD